MIPCNNYLVLAWLSANPFIELSDLFNVIPRCHEVAGMDQYVGFWDGQFPMRPVRITDADNAHRTILFCDGL